MRLTSIAGVVIRPSPRRACTQEAEAAPPLKVTSVDVKSVQLTGPNSLLATAGSDGPARGQQLDAA